MVEKQEWRTKQDDVCKAVGVIALKQSDVLDG